jgi:beta-galactosidase
MATEKRPFFLHNFNAMVTNVRKLLLLPALMMALLAKSQEKDRLLFNDGWKFILDSLHSNEQIDLDEASWRSVTLPHDWSIEGKFDRNNPAGIGGGALPGGIGWYRKTFTEPISAKGKNVFIDFDGIYWNSEVWINGTLLGHRPNGYISFRYDLTHYLKYGKEKNILAVKVDNSRQPNSRWYSGSGIYRNVWLVTHEGIFVDHWGTHITNPEISAGLSMVDIGVIVRNTSQVNKKVLIKTTVLDALGKNVGSDSSEWKSSLDNSFETKGRISLTTPHLWSIQDPYVYRAITELISGNTRLDSYTTTFGIRSFEFDIDKGFSLNGKSIKINGVCDHHDLGCLGAALNRRALERQLEILKAMGCNAIRTSHNPPAPELLELCDRMGFIVMDEAFDMWKRPKNKYDYHLYWDQWHKQDLEDQVLRDRNHPSVFIWSIGNEIPEQWGGPDNKDTLGGPIARELASIVRSLDSTRPVTAACDHPDISNIIIRSGALDLIGYNYHQQLYESFQKTFPGKKFIGTETVSALETRGHYDMPSDSIRRWPERWDIPFKKGNSDLTCSSYDNVSAPWGSTHEETLKIIKKHEYLAGQFIWTGFDYMGEPTPYSWPARSSYFGIVDLAGFPKDLYYLYQSEWTEQPVLHIFPHWNWVKGDSVDVWAFYNIADQVELYLNGKSLGIRKKKTDDLHVMWRIVFEPGTLRAVSRKNGQIVLTKEITTAGAPAKIILSVDRKSIKADGRDLAFITAKIVDRDGNLVPDANNLLKFTLNGPGLIIATDNGSETGLDSFQATEKKAFNGLCLAVVRSTPQAGMINLQAQAEGLTASSIEIGISH